MRFRAPANVLLRRAQFTLILAALVPTVLMTATGIVLLVLGAGSVVSLVGGILVLTFCTSSLAGSVLVSIFVSRGASLARVQNDFLSSVSHELMTPITSIRMFVETLRDDRVTDPAERQKCLAIILQEMTRLQSLVAKLLELSRIESGRQAFERRPLHVDEVVREAVAAFESVKLGTEVRLDVKVEPGLEVMGDHAALTQALVNLLTNAWKYTPAEGKQIALSATSDRKFVELCVTDNGAGIPRGEQKMVFEKFERGKAAMDGGTTGSGLGLAIVRAIVQAHQGKVELTSPPGQGARFRILLPRHAARSVP